jgi:hypothetical protein
MAAAVPISLCSAPGRKANRDRSGGGRSDGARSPRRRGTCVMVLAGNGKLSVGFEDSKRDVIVSLSACDLYNASRDADATELAGGATLSARNIFLSAPTRSRRVPS